MTVGAGEMLSLRSAGGGWWKFVVSVVKMLFYFVKIGAETLASRVVPKGTSQFEFEI